MRKTGTRSCNPTFHGQRFSRRHSQRPRRIYLGRIAHRQGRYPEAVRYLDLALQAHPDYPGAYAELGAIHLRQRESVLTQQAPEKALAPSPNNYVANLSLMIV